MKGGRFKHIGAEFFPGLTLGEDSVPQRSCIKAPSSASRTSKINSMPSSIHEWPRSPEAQARGARAG